MVHVVVLVAEFVVIARAAHAYRTWRNRKRIFLGASAWIPLEIAPPRSRKSWSVSGWFRFYFIVSAVRQRFDRCASDNLSRLGVVILWLWEVKILPTDHHGSASVCRCGAGDRRPDLLLYEVVEGDAQKLVPIRVGDEGSAVRICWNCGGYSATWVQQSQWVSNHLYGIWGFPMRLGKYNLWKNKSNKLKNIKWTTTNKTQEGSAQSFIRFITIMVYANWNS